MEDAKTIKNNLLERYVLETVSELSEIATGSRSSKSMAGFASANQFPNRVFGADPRRIKPKSTNVHLDRLKNVFGITYDIYRGMENKIPKLDALMDVLNKIDTKPSRILQQSIALGTRDLFPNNPFDLNLRQNRAGLRLPGGGYLEYGWRNKNPRLTTTHIDHNQSFLQDQTHYPGFFGDMIYDEEYDAPMADQRFWPNKKLTWSKSF